MEWLSSNWVLLALLGGCIAMHVFGHGRRGGHGCCGGVADDKEEATTHANAGVPPREVPGR